MVECLLRVSSMHKTCVGGATLEEDIVDAFTFIRREIIIIFLVCKPKKGDGRSGWFSYIVGYLCVSTIPHRTLHISRRRWAKYLIVSNRYLLENTECLSFSCDVR